MVSPCQWDVGDQTPCGRDARWLVYVHDTDGPGIPKVCCNAHWVLAIARNYPADVRMMPLPEVDVDWEVV